MQTSGNAKCTPVIFADPPITPSVAAGGSYNGQLKAGPVNPKAGLRAKATQALCMNLLSAISSVVAG